MAAYCTQDVGLIQSLMNKIPSGELQLILKGKWPAEIYVDDLVEPRAAVVWDLGRSFYCAGDHHQTSFLQSVGSMILNHCFEMMKGSHKLDFTLRYDEPAWEEAIQEQLCPDRRLAVLLRRYYTIDAQKHAGVEGACPEGFSIEQVTAELYHSLQEEQRELLTTMFNDHHISCEQWLQGEGFGYCALNEGGDVVSACLTDFIDGTCCELGIETAEAYRRKGLATAVAYASVSHGLECGIQLIGWNCWDENEGSYRTVERIGGVLRRRYPVMTGWFNAFDHHLVQAYRDWNDEQYSHAARQYDEALIRYCSQNDDDDKDDELEYSYLLKTIPIGWLFFNAARAHARIGETQKGCAYLNEAIRIGWITWEKALEDEAFQGWQQNPRILAQRQA